MSEISYARYPNYRYDLYVNFVSPTQVTLKWDEDRDTGNPQGAALETAKICLTGEQNRWLGRLEYRAREEEVRVDRVQVSDGNVEIGLSYNWDADGRAEMIAIINTNEYLGQQRCFKETDNANDVFPN